MPKDLWTITYAQVGSRGTTLTMASHAGKPARGVPQGRRPACQR